MPLRLSGRLLLAAQMCRDAENIIDVGCDHGYLAIYLAQHGARSVAASDIRPGPLSKARENIEKYGVADRVSTVLCPGLEAFSGEGCDTVAICGMGGEMIADILAAAPWTRREGVRLVLQPMTNAPRLRRYLWENGYKTDAERLCLEGERLYCIMGVSAGRGESGESGYLFSRHMEGDPLFQLFIEKQLKRYTRMAQGQRIGGEDDGEAARLVSILKEHRNAT